MPCISEKLHKLAGKIVDPMWAAVCRESAGEIICLRTKNEQLEKEIHAMAVEALILSAYKTALAVSDGKVKDLQAKLDALPPAPAPDHIKDDADVAAEGDAIAALDLNPDGTAKTPPA